MITTSPATSNKERAGIIATLMSDITQNQLIIGDIHAPMDQISEIYKVVENDTIIGGWSIFKGFKIPTIIFPPKLPQAWPAIYSFIRLLDLKEFNVSFPHFYDDREVHEFPWITWDEYDVELQFTDHAYQLTKKELEVGDISHLPEIRAATKDDAENMTKYFDHVEKTENFTGFWHPVQLETDIFVIAEKNNEIIGIGGAHFETPATVQIGNIHVRKDYRGIGLGRAITLACALGVLKTGRLPTLFVGDQNEVAQKLYQSIGFEKYNEFSFFKVTKK